MSQISFALLEALENGASVAVLADRLRLSEEFVQERIEAARLCLLLSQKVSDA
jgi:DNA-binding Lrp family transcriptional regulator